MIPAATTTPITANMKTVKVSAEPPLVKARMLPGICPRIPAMMMIETPLPSPYSVISSPNHMMMMVPPVRMTTISKIVGQEVVGDKMV